MSIIIKGMKMPQKEGDYDGWLHVNRDGTAVFYVYSDFNAAYPAKELPPHGRLIDADALIIKSCDVFREDFREGETYCGFLRKSIMEQPTVIEAEEDKE